MIKFSALLTLGLGLLACGDDTTGGGGDGGAGNGGAGNGGAGNGGAGNGGSTGGDAEWNITGDVTDEGSITFSQLAGGGVLLQLGGGWSTFNLSLEGVGFGETGSFDLSQMGTVTFIGMSPESVLYNCGQTAGGMFPEVLIVEATLLEQGHAAGTFSGGIHCSDPGVSLDVSGEFDF